MQPKLVFYAIQFFEGMGMGSFFPIYARWLEQHGLNFLGMGAVNFFYHIISAMLDPFTGFFADKFGKRKSFILGQILWTATQYIYGLSSQIGGFLLAEGIAAVGHSLKSDALESYLQNSLGEKEASGVMGKAKTLFVVGQITSSIVAGYVAFNFGMFTAWMLSGTLFLIATILGCIVLVKAQSEKEADKDTTTSLSEIFKFVASNKKILSVCGLVATYSFVTKPVFMYWPIVVVDLKMPEALLGWTILAISIPSMFGSLTAGHNWFFTRDNKGWVKTLGILGIGLLIVAKATNIVVFFLGLILVEIAAGTARIIAYGQIYPEAPEAHRSTINSITSASLTLGGAGSLLFMGFLADKISPQGTFAVGGILIALLGCIHGVKLSKT